MGDKAGGGLKFWMERVLLECARMRLSFDADAVHDLRVALRRCRSIADGLMTFDPDRSWRDMRRECKKLFQGLGDLRDAQVMIEWVRQLGVPVDPAAAMLSGYLALQEERLKAVALNALEQFDISKWLSWSDRLSARTERIPPDSPVFLQLALERWHQAHELHRAALRNRTQAAFHGLRVGLKRFRYTIENFLPEPFDEWSGDLRELQDLLGDNHDLFVLWRTALKIGALKNPALRHRWRVILNREREQRLQRYRQKMCGRESAWRLWRAGLPCGDEVRALVLARLGLWASFRDPDIDHARHVAVLAKQLLAGLRSEAYGGDARLGDAGFILEAAAMLHDVGRAAAAKSHHRISARMIRRLEPPLGVDAAQLCAIALVARYHRGALPRPGHVRLAALPEGERRFVVLLAGILRLANALDMAHNGRIRRLESRQNQDFILVRAHGYLSSDPLGQRLACARYLLEMACRMPVWIEGA